MRTKASQVLCDRLPKAPLETLVIGVNNDLFSKGFSGMQVNKSQLRNPSIYYRHGTGWVFPTHKLDLDGNVPCRSQSVCKIQPLRVNIEEISARKIRENKMGEMASIPVWVLASCSFLLSLSFNFTYIVKDLSELSFRSPQKKGDFLVWHTEDPVFKVSPALCYVLLHTNNYLCLM